MAPMGLLHQDFSFFISPALLPFSWLGIHARGGEGLTPPAGAPLPGGAGPHTPAGGGPRDRRGGPQARGAAGISGAGSVGRIARGMKRDDNTNDAESRAGSGRATLKLEWQSCRFFTGSATRGEVWFVGAAPHLLCVLPKAMFLLQNALVILFTPISLGCLLAAPRGGLGFMGVTMGGWLSPPSPGIPNKVA